MNSPPATRREPGDSGFSLVELVVTVLVMSVVALAAATLINTSNRVASSQISIAELQTNHRVAQHELLRMLALAGVGGLPESVPPALANGSAAGVMPNGLALAVSNNVASNTKIGDVTSPRVVEGTDILTVRGVLTTPVYFVEPQLPLTLVNDRVSITVQENVDIGVDQDLEPLREALTRAKADDRPEAFIVRDRYNPGVFAVMELDPANTFPGNTGDSVLTVGLILSDTSGTQQYANEYGRMILGTSLLQGAGGTMLTLPDGTNVQLPRLIGTIGLLEEIRFYIREEWEVRGDPSSRPTPVLARARFFPNTNDMHPEGSVDLAEGLADLQVALGIDLPPTDGQILDTGDENDEVLYNHPNDDDDLNPPPPASLTRWAVPDAEIFFARLSLLAQAPNPDRSFEGIIVGSIEDHDHADSGNPSIFNTGSNPKVRKRLLQTTVDLRNLP